METIRRDSEWDNIGNILSNWDPLIVNGLKEAIYHSPLHTKINNDGTYTIYMQKYNPFHIKIMDTYFGSKYKLSRSYVRVVRDNFFWKTEMDYIKKDIKEFNISDTDYIVPFIWLNGCFCDNVISIHLPFWEKDHKKVNEYRILFDSYNSIRYITKPSGRGNVKSIMFNITINNDLINDIIDYGLPIQSMFFNR